VRLRVILLLSAVLLLLPAFPAAGETAVYFARGRDASLFDQYDIDGFSVRAMREGKGLRLVIEAAPEKGKSRAAYRGLPLPDPAIAASADRDELVRRLCRGKAFEEEAVRSVFEWISSHIAYDPDRNLPQEPSSVFLSRRGYCVGFAELAVDLLRRAGIAAETVQGVLVTEPTTPGYVRELSGTYHRWVRIYYGDRGWRFADPLSGRVRITARYVPFAHRSWTKPEDLQLERLPEATQ
jgi:transglutaminase-like putative cysteine protease